MNRLQIVILNETYFWQYWNVFLKKFTEKYNMWCPIFVEYTFTVSVPNKLTYGYLRFCCRCKASWIPWSSYWVTWASGNTLNSIKKSRGIDWFNFRTRDGDLEESCICISSHFISQRYPALLVGVTPPNHIHVGSEFIARVIDLLTPSTGHEFCWHIMLYQTIPCYTIPYYVIPYHILLYHTIYSVYTPSKPPRMSMFNNNNNHPSQKI